MSISVMLCLTIFLSVLPTVLSQPFSETPLLSVNLTAGTPSYLKISPDESMIVIAFTSNALMGYNFEGQNTVEFNTAGIDNIQQLEWVDGVGPIALASGTVYVWYSNGTFMASQTLASNISIMYMAITSSGGIAYVALGSNNLPVTFNQVYVPEYKIVNGQFVFNQNYVLPNAQPTAFMYSPGRQLFFVATSNSPTYAANLVVTFNISTGYSNGANPNFLQAGQLIQTFAPYANDSFLMIDNSGFVFQFNVLNTTTQELIWQELGITLASPSVVAYCPGTNYFAISSAGNSNYSLVIYEQSVYQGKTDLQAVQSFSGTLTAMDCSAKYLVTVNANNYLIITTYSSGTSGTTSSSGLPAWAIAIIVVISFGVVMSLIIFAFLLVKKRKQNGNRPKGMNNSVANQLLMNSPNDQHTGGQYGNIYQDQYPTQQYPQSQHYNYQVQYPQSQYHNQYQTQYQNQYQHQTSIINQLQNKQISNEHDQNNHILEGKSGSIQPQLNNDNLVKIEEKFAIETESMNQVRDQIQLQGQIKLQNLKENQQN